MTGGLKIYEKSRRKPVNMGFFGVVFEKSLEIAFGSMEHNKKVLKDRFGTVSSKESPFCLTKTF